MTSFSSRGCVDHCFGDDFFRGLDLTLVAALGVFLVGFDEAVPRSPPKVANGPLGKIESLRGFRATQITLTMSNKDQKVTSI
jgi:hypothetical protein